MVNHIKKWVKYLNKHFFREVIQMAKRYIKRCSTLLIIRVRQIKTTMSYHFTPLKISIMKKSTINVIEGVERRESSYTVGENVNWYYLCGEQYGSSLKKLKTELPHVPVVPLLCITLEKNIVQKDTCTPMYIAALFTIAKT